MSDTGYPGRIKSSIAWRRGVFTRDGELRYIVDQADEELIESCKLLKATVPQHGWVHLSRGKYPDQTLEWLHPNDILEMEVYEGWHYPPPPEGSQSGIWDGRGEWLELGDASLPPDVD